MAEKLNEYATDQESKETPPWYKKLGVPALLLAVVGYVATQFGPEVKRWWLEGELEAEIIHAAGLLPGNEGPIGEIANFTIKFVNHTDETVVINELHFLIEADGESVEPKGVANGADSWVSNGLKLPNLNPKEHSRRSAHRDLTLKPGESGKIVQLLFPPLVDNARTKGVYRVTTIVEYSSGRLELPPEQMNVGRTVFETNQIPTQYFRQTENGMEAIGPDI